MRALNVLTLTTLLIAVTASSGQEERRDAHGDALPKGAIARLGSVRFLIPGSTRIAALSPDGKTIAAVDFVSGPGTMLRFVDTATGKLLRRLPVKEVDVDRIEYAADGKSLICTCWGTVMQVDAATGIVTHSTKTSQDRRGPIARSPDGKWLAARLRESFFDPRVAVWDATTGKQVAILPGRGEDCRNLAFNTAGNRLLLWSAIPVKTDGKSITAGSGNKAVVACIDVESKKIVAEVILGEAQEVALSRDGETIAYKGADLASVHVRHLPTGKEPCVIGVAQDRFAFTPDGKALFTIDKDGAARLWDVQTGKKIRDLEGALLNRDVRIAGIAQDGKTIAVLDGGWQSAPMAVVWDADTGRRRSRPEGHIAAITRVVYAPGGKFLASGSLDRTVRLWETKTGKHVGLLATHAEKVSTAAFSPDGKFLASGDETGAVQVCSVPAGKNVANFRGPEKGVLALAFSADGKNLYAGGHSANLFCWDIATEKEVTRLHLGVDGVVKAFSQGGTHALSVHGETFFETESVELRLLEPGKKRVLASLQIQPDTRGTVRCEAAAFAPNGRLFAASQISEYQGVRPSYGNALLRLGESASGQQITVLSKTITRVLAFSPNGRLLASGAPGKSGHLHEGYGSGLDIWDVITRKTIGTLPITPECVAFSPDGRHLATGGKDHALLIWETPSLPAPPERDAPSAKERDALWESLADPADEAYRALGQLLEMPDHALALAKERLRPVETSDPRVVAALIKELDSEKYPERVKAQAALEKLGEGPIHLIRKALEADQRLELRRRLEAVIAKCEANSPQILRHQRAIALLEWLATPASRDLLQSLATGAPHARLTMEAQAVLKR